MSALIGNKGSKSGLVGVPGRLDIERSNNTRTGSQGDGTTTADGATPNFRPTAGFTCGANAARGIGWGIFDQDASAHSLTTRNTTSVGNFARWVTKLYNNTGGSDERWHVDLASITDSGVTLTWEEQDTNSTTCELNLLFMR